MAVIENEQVDSVLDQFEDRRSSLIPILQEVQARFFYLPQDVLQRVARKLRIPITDVYQVATFYRCFSLVPRGKHLVQVCLGTACHVRGGDLILERTVTETAAGPSGTSPDFQFTVEPVRCLGCCGLAPVVRVDTQTFGHLEQSKVRGLLNRYRPKPARGTAEPRETEPAGGHRG